MKSSTCFLLVLLGICPASFAVTAPEQINYQAKVEANGVPFDGTGHFKFAVVDSAGTNTFWSNDGTSTAGSEPTGAVQLNVNGGLLNVMLGDASKANMTNLPASVFLNPDTWLRVWFGGSAGTSFERLAPDSKLASVPYAQVAETLPDRSITGGKIGREQVWPEHEGRSDCVVTYFAEYTGTNLTTVATIPSNKNFVITDVVFGSVENDLTHSECYRHGGHAEILYSSGGTNTILFKQGNRLITDATGSAHIPPCSASFRSGLIVPAGAVLKIGGWSTWNSSLIPSSCTVSGFEIPVE